MSIRVVGKNLLGVMSRKVVGVIEGGGVLFLKRIYGFDEMV